MSLEAFLCAWNMRLSIYFHGGKPTRYSEGRQAIITRPNVSSYSRTSPFRTFTINNQEITENTVLFLRSLLVDKSKWFHH